ncbi:phosphopantetheine-binding protein [Alcaligenes sp. SDU_A2]|uniref:phosphopantetheine-binding protein n=1 Tax=Alcaligenes sp. SDU_A2 TaxID=3136634 RepID=UPI002C6734DA|nr:phosphopantetheine-binding protein [Alcaligenes sp.]HRL26150.1 phosphopantetheine-binding protein [Alcaligenes sp.]
MNHSITLERMRQDIAAMLHEDPQDVLDDDNLMDLGLDSMRVMTLATRWRQAGAPIEFSEMASVVTLGQWWALIERAQQNAR